MGSLICASQRDFNCSMSNRGQVLSNFRLASWRWCLPCLWCIRGSGCVIWGFHRRVYEILILLGCYAAFIGSYRHLGTTYSSHLQGSGLLNALRWNKYLVPKCRCFVWSQNYWMRTEETGHRTEDRTRNLPSCGAVPQQLAPRRPKFTVSARNCFQSRTAHRGRHW